MKLTHTPGPLVVKPGRNGPTIWVEGIFAGTLQGELVAEVFVGLLDRGQEVAQANAANIVHCVNACEGINPEAVPEMLAALEEFVADIAAVVGADREEELLDDWPDLVTTYERACAAIAAAEEG